MRSSPLNIIRMFFVLTMLAAVNLTRANPIETMPVKKVYFIDSTHWSIEFSLNELGVSRLEQDETDTITLGCAKAGSGTIMQHECAMPVPVNKDSAKGYIGPHNFPYVRLQPGWTICLSIKGAMYGSARPELPGDLRSNTMIVSRESESTCTDYLGPDNIVTYTCRIREYVTQNCMAGSGRGKISGRLTDLRNIPLPLFTVRFCKNLRSSPLQTTQTSGAGLFIIENIDTCPAYILQFINGAYSYDYTVRPLKTDTELNLTIPIEYPPVGMSNAPRQRRTKQAPAVRLLSTSGVNRNPVIVIVADNALRGEGTFATYTLGGELVGSYSFYCRGAGTYSIPREGTDAGGHSIPAATYLCRISIGPELVCKTFITR
jgi:hypothetical protein